MGETDSKNSFADVIDEEEYDDDYSDEEPDMSNGFFNRDEKLNYKIIVLRQIEDCRKEWSKEMRRGSESYIYSKELGRHIPIYIPDQRKVAIQSTITLHDLLLYAFDNIARKRIRKIKRSINTYFTKNLNEYLSIETWTPYVELTEKTGIIQTGNHSNIGQIYINRYEDYVLESYHRIYQELLKLYKRKNDLSNVRVLGMSP